MRKIETGNMNSSGCIKGNVHMKLTTSTKYRQKKLFDYFMLKNPETIRAFKT